ncbi:MAG: NADP oxidoreductase [Anaerolineae bacterium]|nr:NADP oxidoreductase [Anaerolineae bacterium]
MSDTLTPKVRIATVWLDGCSGCHMSFLDMDERLLDLAGFIELVYSPLVDMKEFPENVDVTLVEGAVSSVEDLHKIQHIRERTKILVSLGDCAVTANVPSMRNPFGPDVILKRAYLENDLLRPQVPTEHVPPLLRVVRPVHTVVRVDVFIPGCPPPAEAIFYAVSELLAGRMPDLQDKTRFGK